ncbi:flavin carrier protein 2 precursor, putative [Talaromyces stipitatus ATCC 10500]|uniref:Flavin carrier protein 2, putative n=1 Tax=Talaromyces stipitatus (strain ATCC 10500 / CBS 375.48 / QM 6759 / NRRL 1006) TaxID=441959 RepID=B8M161_TALSN|nr:flavin carrier protein 2 precursor, putative [Talaromyces stipitatus ATCC 10500]EED21003.1 flavin carrier protein 2 precursor, putative [Talaromyces stipitatus ATCC 10500]
MWLRSPISLLLAACMCLPYANADTYLSSTSLSTCQDDSLITASLFDVTFFPGNDTIYYDIHANASVTGNVSLTVQVIAYGYYLQPIHVDPCDGSSLSTNFCPIETAGEPIDLQASSPVPADIVTRVPGIAYTVPDLDGKIRILIDSTDQNTTVACLEAELTNGKTVYQKAVGWTLAVIAGLALTASAIASGLGFSNTAAHVAANALSLFSFFQAQAMYGMTSVSMPPIVEAWTQNFQWSMGIIRVGFLQTLGTWYQQATGGTPSTLLASLSVQSVSVQKRSLDLAKRALHTLTARADNTMYSGNIVLKGILRVGFRAKIESSNIFMTGLIFLAAFFIIVILLILVFKLYIKLAIKWGWMPPSGFQDFRNGWTSVMRGILFRLIIIAYPQMVVLCLWELTRRDSAAEAVLAVLMLVSMTATLVWAALNVVRLAKRSVAMHQNPAYILYSNPKFLHTWGFLYVSYRATAYYWVFPTLFYIFAKGAFIGLSQKSPITLTIGLLIIETTQLIFASIFRPWMDKKTNTFNIAICAVHFVNAVFLLMFTSVFDQPPIVNSVMGVVLVLYNAIFALVLLLMVLISAFYAIFSKNPDLRYEPVRDDRGSFIRSQTQLDAHKELDALGATARGEEKLIY